MDAAPLDRRIEARISALPERFGRSALTITERSADRDAPTSTIITAHRRRRRRAISLTPSSILALR